MTTTSGELRLIPRGEATTCPWCHDSFDSELDCDCQSAAIRVCESCQTPTHRECAALHGGCPILGCHGALERPACFACEQPLASPGARVCIACGHDQILRRSVLERDQPVQSDRPRARRVSEVPLRSRRAQPRTMNRAEVMLAATFLTIWLVMGIAEHESVLRALSETTTAAWLTGLAVIGVIAAAGLWLAGGADTRLDEP